MMKVYEIDDGYSPSQRHCVVAENMSEAERVYLGKYRHATIRRITLIAEYVQIQKYDEQKKEM